eukprot:CAMPEP_0197527554 /NCGR_PEP_ID=MMETSP1318-20131121/22117_1 /TAXON_ID=552666 /ORGANISM="Partenskyella glossopodia, Strain RCC365" /LENGTH=78 /DNA_ID=CAMNT_0043082273 /DNA_START=170 /DNA_END=403 /DNA_ORIENTATION=-
MKESNQGFEIQEGPGSLCITIGNPGSYMFNARPKQKDVQMFSPISGQMYTYRYDKGTSEWISVDDGHLMVELLTRELL